ncbi:MAG: gliding motility-associated-like protein [Flavobacteriales bacterium]|jgi:gliding motility-associated-like protein
MKRISLLTLLSFFGTFAFGQVQVEYQTAEEAVAQLLGPGVTASNIIFTGSSVQLGLMYGAEGITFEPDSGIVLSCADIVNIELPGENLDVPFGEGVSGDQDLLDIANSVPPLINQTFSVSAVNDIATLEFDFVPSGDSLSFNYSFGSDEYLTWVNSSFNDIFAFFLSGPGITGPYAAPAGFPDGAINIASVPESDPLLPITISSVNNVLNQQYYIDNPGNAEIAINGYTAQFTASAQVECGATYHIKLAIADGSDTALESIVVIEAGSFQSPSTISASVPNAPPSLPELTMLEGCVDGIFLVFRPSVNSPDTLYLEIGGNATEIDDFLEFPEFVVFPENEVTLEIPVTTIFDGIDEDLEFITLTYNYLNACGEPDTVLAQLNIMNYNLPLLDLPEEIFLCNGENQTVSGIPDEGFPPFVYDWSTGDFGTSIIVTSGGPEFISVEVVDYCENSVADSFFVRVPDPFTVELDQELCLGENTGSVVFGGSTPYEFIYNTDSLTLSGNGFIVDFEGIYEVIIIDACGEVGSLIIEGWFCSTVIPNVFSPNNDNRNDLFVISGLQGFPNSELKIFNRWGGIVYESPNYRNTWNAADVSDGTYYYVLNRSDGKTFNGEVTILRK